MNENLKKGLIIAAAVLAVIVAAAVGFMTLGGGDKMNVVSDAGPPPDGWKSMKDAEMERQGSGAAGSGSEGSGGAPNEGIPGGASLDGS
jgi:hypothetical protein